MFKKIKKEILKFSIFSIIFIFYELTVISNKTINRGLISIDINNIRNPQIKKIMRYIDNLYASTLISYSKNTKLYFNNDDDRDKLPDIKIIKEKQKIFQKISFLKKIYQVIGLEIMEIVPLIDFLN